MKRRTVRITPLGYIVLTIIILVMVVSIYFIVWSMRNAGSEQPQGVITSYSIHYTKLYDRKVDDLFKLILT